MMGIKETWERKIQKNAVISEMTWVDKNGTPHTDEVIMKKSGLPFGDWGRIYPPIDKNGKINYVNLLLGGKNNAFKLLVIMLIVALMFFWVFNILGANREYMDGRKYVIIPKDSFYEYCDTSQGEIISENNLSIFINNPNGKEG